jgi:hypothetical protein
VVPLLNSQPSETTDSGDFMGGDGVRVHALRASSRTRTERSSTGHSTSGPIIAALSAGGSDPPARRPCRPAGRVLIWPGSDRATASQHLGELRDCRAVPGVARTRGAPGECRGKLQGDRCPIGRRTKPQFAYGAARDWTAVPGTGTPGASSWSGGGRAIFQGVEAQRLCHLPTCLSPAAFWTPGGPPQMRSGSGARI